MTAIDGPRLDERADVLVLTFTRPILSIAFLDEIAAMLDHLARRAAPGPLVLASDHPGVFLAGAHLAEIARLEATTAGAYAARGRATLGRLERHPGPVVAAVDGVCAGGGFDLVMHCDAVVASPRSTFSHPGPRRGLVTGWGGTGRLADGSGRGWARGPLLLAGELDAASVATALPVRLSDEPVTAALREARRLATLHPDRLRAWRALRGGRFVDRFRACVVHNNV